MVRISSLPDLSQFVARKDPVKIYNTVHLLVGVTSFEVSGIVISVKSPLLLRLIQHQSEIYLDQFVGEEEGVQDCIELLYGGCVNLDLTNIKTILKFSAVNEIEELFQLGIDWIKENISNENLFELINHGLLIAKIGYANESIFDVCKTFLKEQVKDNLVEISKNWTFSSNIDIIKFLIQEDLLYFTLPVLTSWIQNDSHITMILGELDVKGIALDMSRHREQSLMLLHRMTDKVELLETSKKINKLQSVYYESSFPKVNPQQLNCLLSTNYSVFSLTKVLEEVQKDYNLKHFQFVDILLHWISANIPKQHEIERIWNDIISRKLDYRYLYHVRNTILNMENGYIIADVVHLGDTNYENLGFAAKINNLSSTDKESLLNKQTFTFKVNCGKCKTPWRNLKVKLVDEIPCYILDTDDLHHFPKHLYIYWCNGDRQCYYSLITNDYLSILDKITQCLESNDIIALVCLYTCTLDSRTPGESRTPQEASSSMQ